MSEAPLSFAMLSDPGRVRRRNEDACAADPGSGVFVVCDGVGGAAGGEVASQLAAKTFLARVASALQSKCDPEDGLRDGVEFANLAVHSQSQERAELYGMATTMVAMLFVPDNTGETAGAVWLANVGDSRCYRLRQGCLEQMTHDHSLVGEQVRSGLITREQAEVSPIRNVITRAVGTDTGVQADVQNLPAISGDLFLLASDGLTRELSDEAVAEILGAAAVSTDAGSEDDLAGLCAELVRQANERGGGDNITCLLVRIR